MISLENVKFKFPDKNKFSATACIELSESTSSSETTLEAAN